MSVDFLNAAVSDAAVEIINGFSRFAQEIESTIFSVVQEALTNVHRYSGSPTVIVRVSSDGASILAEIEDHGCGLPASGSASRKTVLLASGFPECANASNIWMALSKFSALQAAALWSGPYCRSPCHNERTKPTGTGGSFDVMLRMFPATVCEDAPHGVFKKRVVAALQQA